MDDAPSSANAHGPGAEAPCFPALALAGALAIGSTAGSGLRWAFAGRAAHVDRTEDLLFALGLGALAAWVGLQRERRSFEAKADTRRRAPRAGVLLLMLAALGRAALVAPGPLEAEATDGRMSALIVGRAEREARDSGVRGRSTWRLEAGVERGSRAGTSVQLQVAGGALARGDRVAVLPSVERANRARGTAGPRSTRPPRLRPLADEVLRLESRSRTLPQLVLQPGRRARAAGVEALGELREPATGGLLCAVLFGELGRVPGGLTDLFTRTGTRHMLALSGLHVGLLGWLLARPLASAIASLVAWACALLGWRWRLAPALPAAVIALAFVPLAGEGAPAARAALALALALVAPRFARRALAPNLLGVALVVEIGLDPCASLRAGVQLSYLATAALIGAASSASRAVARVLPGGGEVAPTWPSGRRRSPWLRVIAGRSLQGVAVGIGTSLVASLATLPVAWARFGEFSPVGLIATPLAFPFLVALVAGGWAWLLLRACLPGTAVERTIEAALDAAATSLVELLRVADQAPWSPMPLPVRSLLWLGAGSLALLVGLRGRERGRLWLRLGALGYGLALLPTPGSRPTGLEVHVLDVGNGTAIVLRAPGEPTWIVDAGSRDRIGVAREAVGPLLRSMDVGRLNVSLSHRDSDHAGALPWIVRRWPVKLWVGPAPPVTERFASGPVTGRGVLGAIPPRDATHVRLQPGRHRITREHRALQIATIQGGDRAGNESSSMLDVRWRPGREGGARLILTGDAEGHGLASMLDGGSRSSRWLEPGPVDVLLLPHHGSPSRHLGWLLDRLRPREVWCSGSELPRDAAEMDRRGIRLRATATAGPFRWCPNSEAIQ